MSDAGSASAAGANVQQGLQAASSTPQHRRRHRHRRPRGRGRGGRGNATPRAVERQLATPRERPVTRVTSRAPLPPKPSPSKNPPPVPPPMPPPQPTELSTRLTTAMRQGRHECLVCLDRIRRTSKLWSCEVCHTITHLHCARKWAKTDSPACPSCRAVMPNPTFVCYCGKRKTPALEPGVTPGSCNDTCLRPRGAYGSDCPHRCTEICHPGPCAPCRVPIPTKCFCGRETMVTRCGEVKQTPSCGNICGKQRECGHKCRSICHEGDCGECDVLQDVACFCGQTKEQLPCGLPGFSCGTPCGKQLGCGKHTCQIPCHEGPCPPCPTSPLITTRCPCGSRALTAEERAARTSCLSPIPACESNCSKPLNCLFSHPCKSKCGHTGACPPCEETPTVTCRCGATMKRIRCGDSKEELRKQLLCDRRCNTRLPCRAHSCQVVCCPHRRRRPVKAKTPDGLFPQTAGHACGRICEKPLSCGKHVCDLSCGHSEVCPPCGILVREPLPCACGAVVLPAPVRCGTPRPDCNRPCSRTRECGHKCPLTCHSDECPPCVEVVKFSCLGDHETRFAACHIGRLGIRCARVCGKALKCGVHVCRNGCHAGPCEDSNEDGCGQKCGLKRTHCGHCCVQPCHPGLIRCPEIPCKELIDVKCPCGRRVEKSMCLRGGPAAQPGQVGQTEPVENDVRLTCDDECAAQARLRAFAVAVGKEEVDESEKYSEFLMRFAEGDPGMLAYFEAEFAQIVSGRVRKATFPILPQLQRLVLHNLAEKYNLDSEQSGKSHTRMLVVRHRGAGVKPVLPRPLLSEAYAERERERKRARGLLSGRTLIVHVASRANDPATMSLEARVERELREHSGAYKISGRTPMSSNIVGISVEFSTAERGALALSSLQERAGITVECMTTRASTEQKPPESSFATMRADDGWDEKSGYDYRLGELRNALPAPPPEVSGDGNVPDSWDD